MKCLARVKEIEEEQRISDEVQALHLFEDSSDEEQNPEKFFNEGNSQLEND